MDKIRENIRQWARDNIGDGFVFREMQEDIITDIVSSVVSNDITKKNHIIEAPTGSLRRYQLRILHPGCQESHP